MSTYSLTTTGDVTFVQKLVAKILVIDDGPHNGEATVILAYFLVHAKVKGK